MVDTEQIIRNRLQVMTKGMDMRLSRDISSVVMTAVYHLIEDDIIEPVYETEEEAEGALSEYLTQEPVESIIKRKLKEETKYDSDPAIAVKWAAITEGIEDVFGFEMDRKNIGLYKDITVECSCGGVCRLKRDVRKNRIIWLCPECGARIGVHKGTNIPLGAPAIGETSRLRIEVHREIERLVASGLSKSSVYRILQRKMGLSEQATHAGKFNAEQCRQAMDLLKEMKGGYRL